MHLPKRALRLPLALLALIGLAALAGPWLWGVDPDRVFGPPLLVSARPSWVHPLGTDESSRDVLARLFAGARISLAFGLLAAAVTAGLGTVVGLVGALGGPVADRLTRSAIDVGLAVPRLLLLIVLTAALGRLPWGWLALAMGASGWFGVARIVRARARELARAEFALATRSLGAGTVRLAVRHVLPNVAGTITAATVLAFGHAVALEAALSFIGQGVPIPTASWGGLINDGRAQLAQSPWLALAPAIALVTTVLAVGALADAMERHADTGDAARVA